MKPLSVIAYYNATPDGPAQDKGRRGFWTALGPTYVRRLLQSLRTALPGIPCTLLTNRPECGEGWDRTVALVSEHPGWWGKIEIFRDEVSEGRCLYTDLDNVIAGRLDAIAALDARPAVMLDDVIFPRYPNPALMLFDAEACRFLWDEYVQQPEAIQREFAEPHWPKASDQGFITERIRSRGYEPKLFQDLLPPGYVLLSHAELEKGADWSKTRIVVGQSWPKPHQSTHPYFRAWQAA